MDVVERKIKVVGDAVSLFGPNDQYLQLIEQKFDAGISARGDVVTVRGTSQEAQQIERVFKELTFILGKSGSLSKRDVTTVLDLVTDADVKDISESDLDNVVLVAHHESIKAKTPTQREYVQAVRKNDIVFAVGPAGTGKSFLAVAMAVAALKNREVNKIVLARPAVEAGESLGFLPGDLSQKVDPYLRPLYDALQEMLTAEKLRTFVERGTVEVIPLAYMRGRTINNAFVILDEAQNATSMQMKMFLTRLGQGSKAIVTGDETQIDLPRKSDSGLIQIQRVLRHVEGIKFVYFNKTDVVRHKLVMDIIEAYDKFHNNTEEGSLFDPSTEKTYRRDNDPKDRPSIRD